MEPMILLVGSAAIFLGWIFAEYWGRLGTRITLGIVCIFTLTLGVTAVTNHVQRQNEVINSALHRHALRKLRDRLDVGDREQAIKALRAYEEVQYEGARPAVSAMLRVLDEESK